jgi:hypothetical protein
MRGNLFMYFPSLLFAHIIGEGKSFAESRELSELWAAPHVAVIPMPRRDSARNRTKWGEEIIDDCG